MSKLEIAVVGFWMIFITGAIIWLYIKNDTLEEFTKIESNLNNSILKGIASRIDEIEGQNLKKVSHEDLKRIMRYITDLKIGKNKPKFKELDKVKWRERWFLGSLCETEPIVPFREKGKYISRYIDYEKGCWMCLVMEGETIVKVKETDLSLDKK